MASSVTLYLFFFFEMGSHEFAVSLDWLGSGPRSLPALPSNARVTDV